MNIIIASTKVPFVTGGAEQLAQGLQLALKRARHNVDVVELPFRWYPPERILDHMLASRLTDLTQANGLKVDLLIGLKFPAYLIPHPNKVMWLLHQHRTAYDFWDNQWGDLIKWPNGQQIRKAIIAADQMAFKDTKKIYTISRNVSHRLKQFNQVESEPLYHPPPRNEQFFCAPAEDYFFFPSRISPPKRQSLVIKALCYTKSPAKVIFSGGENTPYFNEIKQATSQSGVGNRVIFADYIDEKLKTRYYAGCVGVLFPTYDEDYGYVTLEAILSKKPVITCLDSGGPLEFVKHNFNGLVTEPTPEALAAAIDALWNDRQFAQRLGFDGYECYKSLGISWDNVVKKLS